MPARNQLGDKSDRFNKSQPDFNAHLTNRVSDFVDIEGEPVIAESIPLEQIAVDPAQPRRAIPFAIRGGWDGSPTNIPDLLLRWQQAAVNAAQVRIDTTAILSKPDAKLPEHPDGESFPPITHDYIELVKLALSIKDRGQINPITIVHTDNGYQVETGERRVLAMHMLNAFIRIGDGGRKFDRINAQVMPSFSVWRQAIENASRKDLNAIGMARQLARLIMDKYDEPGQQLLPFHEIVTPGKCDRDFYAQVENGYIWKINTDWKDEFLTAMNLPSTRQAAAYRALLSIDDELWMLADNENWTLNAIQTEIDIRTGSNVSGVNSPDKGRLPIGNLDSDEGDNNPPSADPIPAFEIGQAVLHTNSDFAGTVTAIRSKTILVTNVSGDASVEDFPENFVSANDYQTSQIEERSPVFGNRTGSPFQRQPQNERPTPDATNPYKTGQMVDTPDGRGRVIGISSSKVNVQIGSAIIGYDWKTLANHKPPFDDPDVNRVSLEPTDTNPGNGRSGVNVPVVPDKPATLDDNFNLVERVSRHGFKRGDRVTISGKDYGFVTRVEDDPKHITIEWSDGETVTRNDAFVEYAPDDTPPDHIAPDADEVPSRVTNMLHAFMIVLNDIDDEDIHDFCMQMISILTDSQSPFAAEESDYTDFANFFESEISTSILAVLERIETVRNREVSEKS